MKMFLSFIIRGPLSQQPHEGVLNKQRTICSCGFAVGDQHAFNRPGENMFQRRARCTAIDEAGAPLSRCARVWRTDSVKARDQPTPTFKPVARQVLNQIGKDNGAASMMKKKRLPSSQSYREQEPGPSLLPNPGQAHYQYPRRRRDLFAVCAIPERRRGALRDKRTSIPREKDDATYWARRGGERVPWR